MNPPEEITQPVTPSTDESVSASAPRFDPPSSQSAAAPLLMGVKLPIRVLLGRAHLALREIAQLSSGAIVELDCAPNDPVQIMVNDRVIAQGEVVVVAGNYGVRITKIATREEHLEAPGPESDLLKLSEKLR